MTAVSSTSVSPAVWLIWSSVASIQPPAGFSKSRSQSIRSTMRVAPSAASRSSNLPAGLAELRIGAIAQRQHGEARLVEARRILRHQRCHRNLPRVAADRPRPRCWRSPADSATSAICAGVVSAMSASFTAKPSLAADLRAAWPAPRRCPIRCRTEWSAAHGLSAVPRATGCAGALAACTPARKPHSQARCSAVELENTLFSAVICSAPNGAPAGNKTLCGIVCSSARDAGLLRFVDNSHRRGLLPSLQYVAVASPPDRPRSASGHAADG